MWASYTSNLLCHVRSRYTYDMVPIYPEISFATCAITSHEVEAEPKSVPLTWPISWVKCLGWHVHSERFPSFVLGGALKWKEDLPPTSKGCFYWACFCPQGKMGSKRAAASASPCLGLAPQCGLELIYFNSSLTTRSSFAVKDIS